MLVFLPPLDSGEFFGSRSRLDGGSRARGSARKMAPEAFRLNGIFETDGKYSPIEASGIKFRNVRWEDIIEGSGSDGHGNGVRGVHSK